MMKTYALDRKLIIMWASLSDSCDACKMFCENAWFIFNNSKKYEK